MGPAHLGFDMLVGNGLGNRPTTDTNSTPSVTAALHSQLTPSLRVGVSGYTHHAVAGTPTPQSTPLPAAMTQVITGGFVSYFAERLEGIAELQQVANRSAGITTSSPNWFVYGGVRVSPRLVPYVVHDELRLANNDPYFAAAQVRREIVGLRFEQTAAAVLKAELRSTDRRGLRGRRMPGCSWRWRSDPSDDAEAGKGAPNGAPLHLLRSWNVCHPLMVSQITRPMAS